MIIENADYFVRLVPLPSCVGGVVSPNEDGTFNMYLNACKSREDLIDDYIHEFEHIDNDDFYNGKPIEEIENRLEM